MQRTVEEGLHRRQRGAQQPRPQVLLGGGANNTTRHGTATRGARRQGGITSHGDVCVWGGPNAAQCLWSKRLMRCGCLHAAGGRQMRAGRRTCRCRVACQGSHRDMWERPRRLRLGMPSVKCRDGPAHVCHTMACVRAGGGAEAPAAPGSSSKVSAKKSRASPVQCVRFCHVCRPPAPAPTGTAQAGSQVPARGMRPCTNLLYSNKSLACMQAHVVCKANHIRRHMITLRPAGRPPPLPPDLSGLLTCRPLPVRSSTTPPELRL